MQKKDDMIISDNFINLHGVFVAFANLYDE